MILPPAGVAKIVLPFLFIGHASAQFLDDFNDAAIVFDPQAINGWTFYTGDGSATMDFQQRDGYASILVDATKDKQNIWWALIRRCVSTDFNLNQLSKPNHEFRIEARIRVSHAPRRVNLHLNTQRTTDFHTHLMEFDIPDTMNWHAISMTTHDFDAKPGDRIYGQLALMDWGLEKYRVDLDYFKVDIVNVDSVGPDKGVQVPYHPPVQNVSTFAHHITVDQDAMIDLEYPDMNFNNWYAQDETGKTDLLTVSGTQLVIMRWDLSQFAGKRVVGSGVLELTTYSLQRSSDYLKDFGMVRVVEILGGDPDWDEKSVTCDNLCQGRPLTCVLNSQMIIDIEVAPKRGGKNLITISNPVLQRMIEGKTLGLAIRPLGAVHASFYARENQLEKFSSKLHLNVD
ncbi:MAG: hypothetical protein ONB45_05135 [candidate division KSB1 bacterium]|nr:hypothetical protein [candidate division KSB1 bacterium]